jgi:hypothetical protein
MIELGLEKEKMKTILEWPVSCNAHEIKSFRRIVKLYDKFI